jgi:hypothetical protein
MMSTSLRIIFLLTISLALLIAPVAFEIDLGGKAHAMGSLKGGQGHPDGGAGGNSSSGSIAKTYRHNNPKDKGPVSQPSPVPEPTTMLLFGAGAIGLAALKRKFNKK